jgi:hypothetical protein
MLCLLCPTPDGQRPRGGGSHFESLFGDLVRGNDGLWWSITGGTYSPWRLPPDYYGDDEAEEAFYGQFETIPGETHEPHAVASATVFRDTMKYLTDFWLEVHAFREKPLAISVDSWWAGDDLPLAAGVARGADHAFVNVDGAYWAALSPDESVLRGFAENWPLARFVRVAKTNAG